VAKYGKVVDNHASSNLAFSDQNGKAGWKPQPFSKSKLEL